MKKYFFFLLLVFIIMIVRIKKSGHLIYGDGNGYYAYAHAIYFEKSLDFKKIINYYQNFQFEGKKVNRVSWKLQKTQNNHYTNPWMIGTALFWLPSIFIIDIIVKLFQLPFNKFSIAYEIGPFLTGAFLNLGGIFFLEKYLLCFFKRHVVNATIIALIFSTNIIFYAFFEPALSHQPSFFLLAFLLYWTFKFKKSVFIFFIFGLISGLLVITRLTNLVLLLPIYLSIFEKYKFDKYFLFSLIGALIGVLPQAISQLVIYGSLFVNPYLSGANGIWSINLINLFQSLFGNKHGLFRWHVFYLIGLIGLIKLPGRKTIIYFLTFVLLWFVVSGWSGVQSTGFGERMFYESLIYLVYGFAAILNLSKKNNSKIIVSATCLFNIYVFLNFILNKTLQ